MRSVYLSVRGADGMTATPWPLSAIANRVFGPRLSNLMFGWNPASRQAASTVRRDTKRCPEGDMAAVARPKSRRRLSPFGSGRRRRHRGAALLTCKRPLVRA